MEVGEGEEHAHLVARESDLIARRDLFSPTDAERARGRLGVGSYLRF